MKKRKTTRRPARRATKLYIGVDLGGTNVRAGLVDGPGNIIRIAVSPSHAGEGGDRALGAIAGVIKQVMDRRVMGIGVGVPGQVADGRIIKLPNLPDLGGIDIKKALEKRFRKPVRVDNDAKCFALAEARFGHGKGKRCVAGLILGTGCGCGIVMDGKIYHGRDNLAGEFGMIHYRATIIEDYVAGRFIKGRAEELKLPDTSPAAVAKMDNPRAAKIFDELGYHLGYLLSAIICACNPDIIVLGGGVSKAHALFWDAMRSSLDLNLEYTATASTPIKVSTLGEPGVLGAAALFR